MNFEQLTDNSIVSREALDDCLLRIRQNGYCISPGEIANHCMAVAVPIFDIWNNIAASITVCGPKERMSEVKVMSIIGDLKASGQRISRLLGR